MERGCEVQVASEVVGGRPRTVGSKCGLFLAFEGSGVVNGEWT